MAIVPKIQDSPSAVEAARLAFPKTGVRQYQYRYYAVVAGTATQEVFIDGVAGKRLQLPEDCTAIVKYDVVVYAYTTTTGAFSSGAGLVGGIYGATNAANTVAAVANPVAPTATPTTNATGTLAVAADNTSKAVTLTFTGLTGTTTKVVEIIATVAVANKFPFVAGTIN